LLDCHLPLVNLLYKSMTGRDAGLSGSSNTSDTSPQQSVESQDPSNSTMSATTIYPAPYYPPPTAAFNHTPSNPPRLYRRASQPGLPVYSNQCTPVSVSTSYGVSDQQSVADGTPKSEVGPPLPHPTMPQYPSGVTQTTVLRTTNPNTPIAHTLSQPHPRISNLTTPIDPSVHLDIVYHPVSDIVAMLASKLQNIITTNDRLKHSSSSSGTVFPTSTSTTHKSDARLLSFHARNIPSITITAYLNRILKYCPTDPEVFISVLVYFDRILRIASEHARPIFGSYFSSYNVAQTPPLVHSPLPAPTHDDDSFTIDSFNVHRLVITTIAVATKFFSDQFYTNSRYARVSPYMSQVNCRWVVYPWQN
jgi:PHO85 cyclin-6/7